MDDQGIGAMITRVIMAVSLMAIAWFAYVSERHLYSVRLDVHKMRVEVSKTLSDLEVRMGDASYELKRYIKRRHSHLDWNEKECARRAASEVQKTQEGG